VQPPVGVLMLGFAGSSTRILKIVMDSMYLKYYPGWRVVATTASGLATPHGDEHSAAAFSAQMDAIVSGLSGCRKLLVHVMSNNGHGLWGSLLAHRSAQIAPRMGAIVYDCAAARRDAKPDPEDTPGQAYGGWAHVLVATIWMQVMALQILVRAAGTGSDTEPLAMAASSDVLRAAVTTAAEELETSYLTHGNSGQGSSFWADTLALGEKGLNVYSFVQEVEPTVPALLLSSDADTIIPLKQVEDWQTFLLQRCPARQVDLLKLTGTHCMLHNDPAYPEAIKALVERSSLTSTSRIITADAANAAASAAGTPLGAALSTSGLTHLAALEGLASLALDGCLALYSDKGRTAFLAESKRLGVDKLSERQALATTIAKLIKEKAP